MSKALIILVSLFTITVTFSCVPKGYDLEDIAKSYFPKEIDKLEQSKDDGIETPSTQHVSGGW